MEGRYRIVDELGSGGMGVVYRAEHVRLAGRHVALKMLRQVFAGAQDLRPRFEREAHALAALSHPNVVTVTDYGVHEGLPYLTMELIEGRTLRALIDEGPPPIDQALDIAGQILEGLAFAHRRGLAHRDLKPANILLQPLPGGRLIAKILDFGFAKFLAPENDSQAGLSRSGIGFGTPAYMSPEQATGGETDARSDVYSMGVLFFELLTGSPPFEGELPELVHQHLVSQVPPLRDKRPDVRFPPQLEALVVKAMAKKPSDRYADAGEMLAALDGVEQVPPHAPVDAAARTVPAPEERSMQLTQPVTPRSAARSVPEGRGPSRGKAGWVAAILLLGLGAAGALAWQVRRSEREPTDAAGDAEQRVVAVEQRGPEAVEPPAAAEESPAPEPIPAELAAGEPAEGVLGAEATEAAVGAEAEQAVGAEAEQAAGEETPQGADPAALEGVAGPADETPAEAAQPPEPEPADTASATAEVGDPWTTEPVPRSLARLRRRVLRGRAPSDDTIRELREYARAHRTDARPGLLLGHAYVRRSWLSDAVERYELAHRLSPGARGDARMLRNLVWMVGEQSGVARRAAEALATIYGREALGAVDRALAAPGPDPSGRERLEELRQRIRRSGP